MEGELFLSVRLGVRRVERGGCGGEVIRFIGEVRRLRPKERVPLVSVRIPSYCEDHLWLSVL